MDGLSLYDPRFTVCMCIGYNLICGGKYDNRRDKSKAL
ncbi:hypothetical protein SAMN05216540_11225 [Butyrivibrio sp. M55]|nr:hypothetical protein SAMN05216540_11225 [Butyrivibrio sp. M55]